MDVRAGRGAESISVQEHDAAETAGDTQYVVLDHEPLPRLSNAGGAGLLEFGEPLRNALAFDGDFAVAGFVELRS